MAKGKWNRVILREICDSVKYGYTASAKSEPIGPKFLRITDIVPNHIDWSSVPHCEIDKDNLSKYLLKKNDIVIARTGATTGYAKRIRTKQHAIFASYLVRIRINPKCNSKYIGYVIESDEYKQFIQLNIGGAAQPHANAQILTSFPIPLPPLPTQRKIAAILSTYDDLIENNTRRIKILEDMAQTLYREWFVHYRFPGYENVPMVESELGAIPQGWEVKKFGGVSYNFDRLRKPLSGQVRSTMQGEYPYYGAAKILDYINGYLFDGRYLLIGEDGSVVTKDGKPVLQLVTGKFWVNNHTHVVQGKSPISTNFLYLFMSNVTITSYITGAAQPKINQENLNRIPVIFPPENLLEQFENTIQPNFENIIALNLKNANLCQTRDLLLPKLISGKIDVSDLDIDRDSTI
ncbi:MAG: restriction endonuclease subunit S [Candidatus Poribacteria bacterium]|nr:restriction endonuclease subunit S [Candidatus Poribacteria bacterium]